MMALGGVTNPSGTEKLHQYWVHGEGAAKIRWGEPGDFGRCVMHLSKYIRDPKGYCAKAHHDALGVWPGQEGGHKKGRSMDASAVAAEDRAPKPYGNVTYADPKNGKYPIDTKEHAKAAWSYINQAGNAAKYPMNGVSLSSVKGRIKAACKKFGIMISGENSADPAGEFRTVPFDIASSREDDGGLTFEGYAAVYGHRARIAAIGGDFDEQVMPGAFRAITDGKYPKLLFEHGRHPLIGTLPIGVIRNASDDSQGLWIEGRLTDNWLIQPVRDAVHDKAVDGMSFRFYVNGDDGDSWESRSGDVPLRSLIDLDVPELGPVVFPAYEPTTASVRSLLDQIELPADLGRPSAGARAASGREDGVRPGRGTPPLSLETRFRADGEALAMRGIKKVTY